MGVHDIYSGQQWFRDTIKFLPAIESMSDAPGGLLPSNLEAKRPTSSLFQLWRTDLHFSP
jgi:hypothetical protein